jgi:hypothetical protein
MLNLDKMVNQNGTAVQPFIHHFSAVLAVRNGNQNSTAFLPSLFGCV